MEGLSVTGLHKLEYFQV